MKITIDMFRLLCISSQIDSSFIALIISMGKKSEPRDEHFMSSYSHIYGLQPKHCKEKVDGKSLERLSFGELPLDFGFVHG